LNHVLVVPVLLPAACAVLMLLAGDERIRLQRAVALLACVGLAIVALGSLEHASRGAIETYRLGDWPAPFGIVLVLDRLAALMLTLTAVVALTTLAASMTGPDPWDRRGRFFHAFFQFLLAGLNGAFLTGDLFNLFVFFELLLVASYCLLLHGQGTERLRAGFHYVVVNLAASALFLIGIAALYSVAGTLNLVDLAFEVARLGRGDLPVARAAALLLLVVFAVKAAVFPLYFWLPGAYAAAAPPVAALFAIMTKVGVYAILRVHGLVFGPDSGGTALVAAPWLLVGAVATVAFGAVGAFAAASLARMAAYLTIASVGSLLIGVAVFSPASLGAALYYLVHSTLALAALFLLVAPIAAQRGGDALVPRPPVAQQALLGVAFAVCAVAIAGLPPLAGFVGKLGLLQATGARPATPVLWAVLLAAGLAATIALARAASAVFWKTAEGGAPAAPVSPASLAPMAALLACGIALAVFAGPVKRYTDATARQLADWRVYDRTVLDKPGQSSVRPFPPRARQ
jgi:multicomponent K+:H+ antiporter subunit D